MTKRKLNSEVIIIGAGAAGLECAHRLQNAGIKTIIIESRDRIGGRIQTSGPNLPSEKFPVELGAEFIHGTSKLLFDLIERESIPIIDVLDNHLLRYRGRLKSKDDFFDQVSEL